MATRLRQRSTQSVVGTTTTPGRNRRFCRAAKQKAKQKKVTFSKDVKVIPSTGNETTEVPTTGDETTEEKSRTGVFKKIDPLKPFTEPVSVSVSANSIFYKGTYYTIGDIVSLMGFDDKLYYAQLRGFMQDQYCEKSAVISWLIPTNQSPPADEGFDPETYIAGPSEELPRKLSSMEFVMHAPTNYFKNQSSPYVCAPEPKHQMKVYNTKSGPVIRSMNDPLPPENDDDE